MSDPHTLAGGAVGAGISSVALLIGAHVDALVLAALGAIFVSIWLQTIDKFHKALAAVLFSALLGGYGSPVAAEWVIGTVPSIAANQDAVRLLLAIVIGSLVPGLFPVAVKYLGARIGGQL